MPTSRTIGKPSLNNQKLGGAPILHYFDLKSRGRAQALRLFFEDAQIAFTDVRYTRSEWNETGKSQMTLKNPTGNIPVIELGGNVLAQTYPIFRHFARLLDDYDGANDWETYRVDVMCDIGSDWYKEFGLVNLSPNKKELYPKYVEGKRAAYLRALETHLNTGDWNKAGPFILGDRISYADFVVYQMLHDEDLIVDGRAPLKNHPRLAKLADGVEARPNVKAFLNSDRYLG